MNTRGNMVALYTLVRREVMRIVRIWTQTLIPPAITMTLYFIIFGTLVGKRIGLTQGFTYMQFIAPGLIMMSVIMNSYGNVTSSFFGSKFGHYVEEMLVSPMPSWVILSGYVIGAVIRGIVVGLAVLLIALFFTDLHIAHPLAAIATALLTSIVFALAGFINAMFATKFDDIAIMPTFILTPLTYLGGIFYSVSALGEPWHSLSLANPILYMVNTFRYGVLGITDINVGVAFAVMIGFVVLLGSVCLYLLRRGIGLRS